MNPPVVLCGQRFTCKKGWKAVNTCLFSVTFYLPQKKLDNLITALIAGQMGTK
jgi:hypothetical protein